MIEVKRIEKHEWYQMAGKAHLAVFDETWDPDLERIDYALLTVDEKNSLIQYATLRELDRESVYISYGGSFPNYKGSVAALKSFQSILGWLYAHYKHVSFLTENTNFPMLKFGIKEGFRVVGIRNFKGKVMLEHFREREI